jgi:Membrane protease subunits, stomatin/prohibitin homologs
MRLNFLGGIIAVLFVAALIVAYSSLFTVNQTQQALVLRLGSPLPPITEPGLHVKAPFIDSVVYIDKRILDLEAPSQEVIASDQKRLVVDAFARYRIRDPLRFYQTLGSIAGANSQLSILLNSALRRVLGEVTFTHVVRDQRAELMSRIRELVDREATSYGVQVVDVRIRRADLPEQNSQAVYQRMQTERQREAAEFRAQGAQRAQEIRSRADREVTVLVAGRPRSPNRFEVKATPPGIRSSPKHSARTRTSSPSTARCRPTSGASSRMTPAWCSNRIQASSDTSEIRPASCANPRQRRRQPKRRPASKRERPVCRTSWLRSGWFLSSKA